ncbi:MAG: hypothetical protein IJN57_10430 [Oscillospiraceae bacterium]|nr:hypothetical protein [Oscillospiraceae bacterium]
MKNNDIVNWKGGQELTCLLFFAQRLDELLFHHSLDTYRYSALSLTGLAIEYCTVYDDVKEGKINDKNLSHIIDEFVDRLPNDDVANAILTPEFSERFRKGYGSWKRQDQYENMRYVARKLSSKHYYDGLVDRLKKLIAENNAKKEIDKYASYFVRELIDNGYNENYVYDAVQNVFFVNEVSSLDSLDVFFNCFSYQKRKFDVYIGYSIDIKSLFPLFEKMAITDLDIELLDVNSVPVGIKTSRQKSILRFKEIESYEMYNAYEIANAISSCVVNSYSFFRHNKTAIKTYGQVVSDDGSIKTIRQKKLLKYRLSMESQKDSEKNAEILLRILFSSSHNLSELTKLTRIHNSAIHSENTNDSLLALWSILEAEAEEDSDEERGKCSHVIENTMPFQKSTYIQKLVQTCMLDIVRWNKEFFDAHIANNGFGSNDMEHTFAFLAFRSMQSDRNALFEQTQNHPLLKYRVCCLSDQLMNSKGIKTLIANHTKRITWHIRRIYRARNYIIHDAAGNEQLNQELVLNLHSYVDLMFIKIISLLDQSPYNDSIHDILIDHKLAVSIMDEKLKNQENEDLNAENAYRYLYYDFQR